MLTASAFGLGFASLLVADNSGACSTVGHHGRAYATAFVATILMGAAIVCAVLGASH